MKRIAEVKKLRRCEVEDFILSFLISQLLSFCPRGEFKKGCRAQHRRYLWLF